MSVEKLIMELETDDGLIEITADEIAEIEDEFLKRWRITRAQLRHCLTKAKS